MWLGPLKLKEIVSEQCLELIEFIYLWLTLSVQMDPLKHSAWVGALSLLDVRSLFRVCRLTQLELCHQSILLGWHEPQLSDPISLTLNPIQILYRRY